MNKNLKIQILTIISLAIVTVGIFRTVKTYQKNQDEGKFEGLLVGLVAASNAFLILTIKKRQDSSIQDNSQNQDKVEAKAEVSSKSPLPQIYHDELVSKSYPVQQSSERTNGDNKEELDFNEYDSRELSVPQLSE